MDRRRWTMPHRLLHWATTAATLVIVALACDGGRCTTAVKISGIARSEAMLPADDRRAFHTRLPPPPAQVQETTIAFLGDSGVNVNAQRVFRMVRDRADAVVHAGDFAYEYSGAGRFAELLTGIFGQDYPYMSTLGDHDLHEERVYRDFFVEWNQRATGLECEGKWGVASVCRYRGIVFFGLGLMFHRDPGYDEFLDREMERHRNWPFKFCFWHRVDEQFQPGFKSDSTGTHFYEKCRRNGAAVVTAHEHAYARTHSLSTFEEPYIDEVIRMKTPSGIDKVVVGGGLSIAVVSGLAGEFARGWNAERIRDPWWASVVGRQNAGDAHGCLFCTFHRPGYDPRTAYCEFQDTDGVIHDRFEIESIATDIDSTHYNEPTTTTLHPEQTPPPHNPYEYDAFSWVKRRAAFMLGMDPIFQYNAAYQHVRTMQTMDRSASLRSSLGRLRSSKSFVTARNIHDRIHSDAVPITLLANGYGVAHSTALPLLHRGVSMIAVGDEISRILLPGTVVQRVRIQLTGSALNKRNRRTCPNIIPFSGWCNIVTLRISSPHSQREVVWRLNVSHLEQAGDKVVWTSPNLQSLLGPSCYGTTERFATIDDEEPQPSRQPCVLFLRADDDDGQQIAKGAFVRDVRVPPRLIITHGAFD